MRILRRRGRRIGSGIWVRNRNFTRYLCWYLARYFCRCFIRYICRHFVRHVNVSGHFTRFFHRRFLILVWLHEGSSRIWLRFPIRFHRICDSRRSLKCLEIRFVCLVHLIPSFQFSSGFAVTVEPVTPGPPVRPLLVFHLRDS